MQIMTRSLLIYRLTGSAAILGILALAYAIPQVCTSLFGGVIADRFPRKQIILAGHLFSVIVTLGIALSLTLGYLTVERAGSWWILLVATVLQGIIWGLTQPARQAIIPQLVDKEQIMNAIALNTMSMHGLRLLAPAVTGFLIDAFDFEAVYFTMTSMFLIAVILVAFLPRISTETITGVSVLNDIKEGVKYIRSEIAILSILVLAFLVSLFTMPYTQLMPIFADDILMVGARGMGVLMSISGFSAIVTALILATLSNRKRGLVLLLSVTITGIAVAVFSFSTSWILSLAAMVFVGVGFAMGNTMSNSIIHYYIDPGYRGRTMSLLNIQISMVSVGAFIMGMLADNIGVQWALGGFSMGLIFISLLMFTFFSKLRRLE